MQCPTCSGPIVESDGFCGTCGARLPLQRGTSDGAEPAHSVAPIQPPEGIPQTRDGLSRIRGGLQPERSQGVSPPEAGDVHASLAPVDPTPAAGRARGGTTPDEQPEPSADQTFIVRKQLHSLAYLVEKEGEHVGRVFPLEGDIIDVGRDRRNHVRIVDTLVSGFHLRIDRVDDGRLVVMDLRSSNGTLLNDGPLIQPQTLHDNDRLRIGNTTLVLKVVD
jgi:hypothetical protein